MQGAAGLATAAPTKVFNQNMTIIDTSEATLAADAKDKASLLNIANVVVPVVVLIVGILLLLVGGFLIFRNRKASAGATPPPAPSAS
jgi:predicted small integral membrane protein